MPVGWGVGLFWVFSQYSSQKFTLLIREQYWRPEKQNISVLLVVCLDGDLLKGAHLESSVCIMDTCWSWHLWIKPPDVSPAQIVPILCRFIFKSVWANADSRLPQWAVKPVWIDVKTQPTWLFFGPTQTHCLSALNVFMCVSSEILHVSHQLSIFRKNKHMPFEKLIVALTNYLCWIQTRLRVWDGDHFILQGSNGGHHSSLTLVVKCLTCFCCVRTDSPATKPGLAGQEKGPHSSPIFLSMPIPERTYCLILHPQSLGLQS